MRVINLEITNQENRIVEVVKTAVAEDFDYINEYKSLKYIEVRTVYFDENNIPLQYQYYEIKEDLYDLLMSASPDFAPGKPENEYREIDLWYIIDLIRAEQE